MAVAKAVLVAAPVVKTDGAAVLKDKYSNELFFAVVGPVGAGSSHVVRQLERCFQSMKLGERPFQCNILKAGDAIRSWAEKARKEGPAGETSIDTKIRMQGYGDEMRAARKDNSAVAVDLVERIAEARAKAQGLVYKPGTVVEPDGTPRAYILDSFKHPAEAQLMRRLYGDAFVLIGVVCSEPMRESRLLGSHFNDNQKKRPENKEKIKNFMKRDSDDTTKKHGQHVADTFQEVDFFVDNTAVCPAPTTTGDMKDAVDARLIGELNRLVSILLHKQIVRPSVDETAMHMAFSAKLRSSCLSRQVGAALIDRTGNILATGTNEVPKAGGGVYGEGDTDPAIENRCALCDNDGAGPHCSNNYHQNEVITEILSQLYKDSEAELDYEQATSRLRKTTLGGLLEFSRSVHAEMDALLSAARAGISSVGTRLFVTTFPCHYCARHIVTAGVYEVQYIEPYPKSRALALHGDAIETVPENWIPPRESSLFEDVTSKRSKLSASTKTEESSSSRDSGKKSIEIPTSIKVGVISGEVGKVLFRPFVGVSPTLYQRVFVKDRDYKDKMTGKYSMGEAEWGSSWSQFKVSYANLEAELATAASSQENDG